MAHHMLICKSSFETIQHDNNYKVYNRLPEDINAIYKKTTELYKCLIKTIFLRE